MRDRAVPGELEYNVRAMQDAPRRGVSPRRHGATSSDRCHTPRGDGCRSRASWADRLAMTVCQLDAEYEQCPRQSNNYSRWGNRSGVTT